MRLVYLGTPELAVAPLAGLHRAGHDIALVVSAPDRRRGRGAATSPTPVKAAAEAMGLPVSDQVDAVLDVDAELGVVVAFGQILRPHILRAVPMLNLHFSLLPRWRGAAPVERAILAGDTETGVCLMAMDEGLDTGAVYSRSVTAVGSKTTAELWEELSATGTELLLGALESGLGDPEPQSGEVTYAHKITNEDRRLDPATQSADHLWRVVRVGGAWTEVHGRRLKVHSAELREGAFVPLIVQAEGRGPVSYADFLRGARLDATDVRW